MKVCSHGDGVTSVRLARAAWPLQGWTLLSAQGVDVMKNGPQSPAGLNIVDFPSQLQHFVLWEAKLLEQQADVGEVHAQKGVALKPGLCRPAHWG